MQATPTDLIARRCGAVVAELEAIASCELAGELEAIKRGEVLTPAMQTRLAGYLRAELGTHGLLSYRQLADDAALPNARAINRQAKLLLALVCQDGE
jgi:hypothetical protein